MVLATVLVTACTPSRDTTPIAPATDPAPRTDAVTPVALRECVRFPGELVAIAVGGADSFFGPDAGALAPMWTFSAESVVHSRGQALASIPNRLDLFVHKGPSRLADML